MSTTTKKSEMLAATKADVVAKLPLEEIGAVQIGVGLWAVPGPVIDGIQTYAKVSVTAANPIGTEKVPAFDLDEAVEKFREKVTESEAKAAERKAKHDERVKADQERKAKRAAEKAAKEAEKAE